ncbi:MAG TPA: PEP-utilizing enzyme [Vicinamibacterales bacterium]|nr:PEP-utilizing enzyme [Vicinamibacterales bacterium]
MTKPPSILTGELMPAHMMRGFSEGSRHYGMLLDYLEVAIINRFLYMAPRPVGAPKSAKGTPPRLLFALMRRLHPAIRQRVNRATAVFRDRVWRADMEWWDTEVRPTLAAEARALLSEDLASLSDAQLVAHLQRAFEFLRSAVFYHHRFNFCSLVPLGDFLVHAMGWTGLPAGELLRTMKGLSPDSAGATAELAALKQAILADGEALARLTSRSSDADIMAALEAHPGPVGVAMRTYMGVVGLRVLGGYDVADRHGREHPELIVKIIRSAVTTDTASRQAAAEDALQKIRARVPEAHRAQFEDLLREAQDTYRMRDERGFHTDTLAIGVVRRAVLGAGERLKARGLVHDASHLVDASPAEIVALVEGRPVVTAGELAERVRWRLETPLSAAPANLGHPPSAPPPAEWFPADAARIQRVTILVMSLLFDVHAAPKETTRLKGFPVSPGVYEGPVRVIRSIEELPDVQQGEVLVTTSTGPTFNVVLPLIGALVTERGGVLSHAAIVSREYGLPGVVGCVGATKQLKTGVRVRVDGSTGEVWALA